MWLSNGGGAAFHVGDHGVDLVSLAWVLACHAVLGRVLAETMGAAVGHVDHVVDIDIEVGAGVGVVACA